MPKPPHFSNLKNKEQFKMQMESYWSFIPIEESEDKERFIKSREQVFQQVWQEYCILTEKIKTNKVLIFSYSNLQGNILFQLDPESFAFKKVDSRQEDYIFLTPSVMNNDDISTAERIVIEPLLSKLKYRWVLHRSGEIEPQNTMLTLYISNTDSYAALGSLNYDTDHCVNDYAPYFGNNPLLLAVSKGWNHLSGHYDRKGKEESQKEIIKDLLKSKKLDVNAIHLKNGMTALHIACLRGDDPELIRLLLDKGADCSLKDYNGTTPIELLETPYENMKEMIERDTGGPVTRKIKKSFFANAQSDGTATIPTELERSNNIQKIRQLLSSLDDDPDSKKRRIGSVI